MVVFTYEPEKGPFFLHYLKVGNLRRYFQSKWIFGLKIALVETTSVETVLLETENNEFGYKPGICG